MYDLLIVGAGLTAATLVAQLKHRLRICVIDCRDHLGGNCFDYASEGTLIHRYGPHIFHSPSPRITEFLQTFTEFIPYTHSVTAEINDKEELRHVPFPYCRQTAHALGRELFPEEILEKFYRGYSQKMWGLPWEELPASVRRRVPTDTMDAPTYYRDHFTGLPKHGYTRMMENMFDGAELILGAPPLEWINIPAATVVYTGRPDLIPVPGEKVTIAENEGLQLDFRTLEIKFAPEEWGYDTVCLHACTLDWPWTRKTNFNRMTGGNSRLISTEFPRQAAFDEVTPYYPIEIARNQERFEKLAQQIKQHYPNLHLAGRLGSYRYFDMYQAVGHALALVERLWTK